MRKGVVARACAVLTFFCVSARGLASTVERLTLAEVVARAERIVEGEVSAVESAADLRGRPATRVTIDVKTSLKGDAEARVSLLFPGGVDAQGNVLVFPGVPAFRKGETVVLLVTAPSRAGLRLPVGLGQGAYRASADASTKKTLYTPDLAGADDGAAKPKGSVDARGVAVEREALLARIRGILDKK
jgi:hypothetical protein